MPHRCIECKNILESGELDLDKGCPVCGGKKFQYIRPKKEPREAREKSPRKLTVAEYVAQAAAAEPEPEPPSPGAEEHAEKTKPKTHNKKPEKSAAERIESVRILEKGRYDINLPVLMNRKELVMSKEEGVYVVDLPSALKASPLKTPKKKKRWLKEG